MRLRLFFFAFSLLLALVRDRVKTRDTLRRKRCDGTRRRPATPFLFEFAAEKVSPSSANNSSSKKNSEKTGAKPRGAGRTKFSASHQLRGVMPLLYSGAASPDIHHTNRETIDREML